MSVLFKRWILSSRPVDWLRRRWRSRRMEAFLRLMQIPARARIIDLGGSMSMWELIDHDYQVTLVNRSRWALPQSPHKYRIEVADACDLHGLFADQSFDLVFSNSTIEHLGGPERRQQFAAEVLRLAPAWWIQTPCGSFPIEAHTGLPFYWSWPRWAQARAEATRRHRHPEWYEEMQTTVAVDESEMLTLFPGSAIYRERVMGLVKSFTMYRKFPISQTPHPP